MVTDRDLRKPGIKSPARVQVAIAPRADHLGILLFLHSLNGCNYRLDGSLLLGGCKLRVEKMWVVGNNRAGVLMKVLEFGFRYCGDAKVHKVIC